MSATRMMILGLVCSRQPVHGYDVRRELLSWRADEWANVHPGSVYHALKKLTAEGLLKEVTTERVGSRPARTTYEITPEGRAEFDRLLRRYLCELRPVTDPFLAGFSFLPTLSRQEAASTLRDRGRALRGLADYYRALLASDWIRDKPVHVRWQYERGIALAEADAAWCEEIADRLTEGLSAEVAEDWAAERWRLLEREPHHTH